MTLKTRRCCKLKEEALERILWTNRFGIGYGPVVIQTMWLDDYDDTYFQPRIVKNALSEGYFVWRTHSRHLNFLYLTTLSACLLEAFKNIIHFVSCRRLSLLHFIRPTPRRRILLEKLTAAQLSNKFLKFFEIQNFITFITRPRHRSLSWARSIQYTPSQ